MNKTIKMEIEKIKEEIEDAITFEDLSLIAERRSDIAKNGEEALYYYIEWFIDGDITTISGKITDESGDESLNFHILVELEEEDYIFIKRLLKTMVSADIDYYDCYETRAILEEALYGLEFKKARLETL